MLLYHHCTNLEKIIFGEIKANPRYSEPDFKNAYLWLEKEVGFYPLFLAVGETEEDIRMTGYQSQWRIKIASGTIDGKVSPKYRKAREFPIFVLFSFEDVGGIFTDYDAWHLVLNAEYKDYNLAAHEKKMVFKPSWPKSRWLRKAKEHPGTVQLVAPKLHLPDAGRIWVRNKKAKKQLESVGFKNIEVKRLLLEEEIF